MVELNELKKTTDLVKKLLIQFPELRNDDDLLYRNVCKEIYPAVMTQFFGAVLRNRRIYGLPSFETVRRTRQKVQATYPELKGTKRVREGRKAKETEYREYARGSV